jgi:hypothetical protein
MRRKRREVLRPLPLLRETRVLRWGPDAFTEAMQVPPAERSEVMFRLFALFVPFVANPFRTCRGFCLSFADLRE